MLLVSNNNHVVISMGMRVWLGCGWCGGGAGWDGATGPNAHLYIMTGKNTHFLFEVQTGLKFDVNPNIVFFFE